MYPLFEINCLPSGFMYSPEWTYSILFNDGLICFNKFSKMGEYLQGPTLIRLEGDSRCFVGVFTLRVPVKEWECFQYTFMN